MRAASTYRGARRNFQFGRKPRGNTKPEERRSFFRKRWKLFQGAIRERKQ